MNNEQQIKTTARDFLRWGLESGAISEKELAQWIVDFLDHDTDAIKRLISEIKDEQVEYIHDWFEDLETGDKHKAMIKIDTASQVGREHYELTE